MPIDFSSVRGDVNENPKGESIYDLEYVSPDRGFISNVWYGAKELATSPARISRSFTLPDKKEWVDDDISKRLSTVMDTIGVSDSQRNYYMGRLNTRKGEAKRVKAYSDIVDVLKEQTSFNKQEDLLDIGGQFVGSIGASLVGGVGIGTGLKAGLGVASKKALTRASKEVAEKGLKDGLKSSVGKGTRDVAGFKENVGSWVSRNKYAKFSLKSGLYSGGAVLEEGAVAYLDPIIDFDINSVPIMMLAGMGIGHGIDGIRHLSSKGDNSVVAIMSHQNVTPDKNSIFVSPSGEFALQNQNEDGSYFINTAIKVGDDKVVELELPS